MSLPSRMRSLVAPKKCQPSELEVHDVPIPELTSPTHVLIKMYAAVIITGDMQVAAGQLGIVHKAE